MEASDFKGIIPPMMTAFTKEGEIYEEGTRRIVDFIIPHVQGLFPCGTYGSGPMMSIAERKRTAEIVVDQTKGRVPVIVHVGTADTKNTVELARHAASIGARAVAAITPYYNSYSEDDIFIHFQQLIHAVDIPVFLYNNPKASGNSVSPNLLVRLAAVPGIQDTQCGFKAFRQDVARELFPLQTIEGWGFDVEILFIAQRFGYEIVEVPVTWYYGQRSKVRPIHDTIGMLQDLVQVRRNARQGLYDRPA